MSFLLGQKRFGIIFDLDNTLVPTSKCYDNALIAVKKLLVDRFLLSKDVSESIVERYHILSSSEQPFHAQNKLSVWEWRESLFKQALVNFAQPQVDVTILYRYFHETILKDLVLSEEVVSLLAELRKTYKLGILTNGDSKHQWTKIKNCQVERFVDAVIVSGDHDIYKPDPRIFHITCRKLGLENRQCIMVGDRLTTDILGSQKAGFKGSILVKGKDIDKLNEIKPDHIISNVCELQEVLNKSQFS